MCLFMTFYDYGDFKIVKIKKVLRFSFDVDPQIFGPLRKVKRKQSLRSVDGKSEHMCAPHIYL